MPFGLENASFDEWPQVLVEDPSRISVTESTGYALVAALHYLLMQRDLEHAARYISSSIEWVVDDRFCLTIFHTLYAAKSDLLRRFFDAAILLDRSLLKSMFERAAPVAMGVDPTLGKHLVAMAKKFNLAVPVAEPSVRMEKLVDDTKAGGNVHMQLLTLVDKNRAGFRCRASLTRKTVAYYDVQLHVAAGNVLHTLAASEIQYLYIRNFEQAKARRGVLVPGRLHKVKVQHGDVVVVHYEDACPYFLKAEVDCTGLPREDCFERVKSFCRSARDKYVGFMAIMESDNPINGKGEKLLEAMKRLHVSRREQNGEEESDGVERKDKMKERKEKRMERRARCAEAEGCRRGLSVGCESEEGNMGMVGVASELQES